MVDELSEEQIVEAAEFYRLRKKTKARLSEFVKTFWSHVIEEPMEWNWHMDVLCDEVQFVYERTFLRPDPNDPEPDPTKKKMIRLPKLYDLIINIPPGTTKSTIVTVMAPAWSWACDPSLRHITGSYSSDLSIQHAVKSRDLIKSDLYQELYPHVEIKLDEDNKTDYKTVRNGQRFSTSIGGTVTGVHAHVITYDDPVNPKQAVSVDMLKTANDYFDQTLSTRKVDKRVSVLILVMQRLGMNDPSGYLLDKKKKKIRHLCLPATVSKITTPGPPVQDDTKFEILDYIAEYQKQDGYLDQNRLGQEVLEEALTDLGSAGFAGQMDQTPTPAGGLTWKAEWFKIVPDELFPHINIAREVSSDWDLAYTNEEENAASAYVTSGIVAGQVYIFDFDWKWLEFPPLIKWMKTIRGPHYIEAKASGKSAKQTLSQRGVIAIEVNVQGGADKVARARAATPIAEAGMVYIKKSMADRLFNDSKQGILFFPKGQHKDLADALAQALQRRSRKGKVHIGDPSAVPETPGAEQDPETEEMTDPPKVDPLDWLD